MATVNLVLDTRREKKDKTFPIKLSVSHKQKTAYITTKFAVKKNCFKNGAITKSCMDVENVREANRKLSGQLNDAYDYIEKLEIRNRIDSMNVLQVVEFIKNGGQDKFSDSINFIDYLEGYIKTISNPSTKEKYESTLTAIKGYKSLLFFEEINKAWLNRFKEYRMETVSPATVNIDLRNIRALFNRAIDVDEIIDQGIYPFRKFEFAKSAPRNLRLPIEKIKAVRDYKSDKEHYELARDFFMLSFYLIGMNNSDIYNMESIIDGRIEYSRNKTQKDYSVKVEPEAMEIMERRKGEMKLLIYQERYANFKNLTKQINKHLKEIGKDESVGVPDLMMYHARHSWAGIAARKPIGAGKPLIAQALGHGKTTVTDAYFDYDVELVDDLNRKILDMLKK